MQKIKDVYQDCMRDFEKVMSFPWKDPDFYAAWLAQTYYYTRRGTRILLLASAHFGVDQNPLHSRFSKHAQEEKGHEVLAQRDCAGLGHDVEEIGEFATTKAFYRTQYYTVQNEGAETLFGWILALEGLAVHWGEHMQKKVKEGDTARPTSFLDVHVGEDPDHIEVAFETLEKCDLKRFGPSIVENMKMSVDLYCAILQDCQKWSQQVKKGKAA